MELFRQLGNGQTNGLTELFLKSLSRLKSVGPHNTTLILEIGGQVKEDMTNLMIGNGKERQYGPL